MKMGILKMFNFLSLFNNFKMKNKIKFMMIGLSLLIIVSLLSVSGFYFNKTISRLIVHNISEIATKQFELIEEWMERRVENIEKISQSIYVISSVKEFSEKGEVSFERLLELKEYINEVMFEQEVYIRIGITDTKGDICYYTDGISGSIADELLFKGIKDTDDVHIAHATIDSSLKGMRICQAISYPIYEFANEDGGIIGYIIGYINLDILDDSISMINLGGKGYAYLVDKNGNIICSSTDYEHKINKAGLVNYRLIKPETNELVYSINKCINTNHAGHGIYIDHHGVEVIGVWKWYSYFEWIFLIEIQRTFIWDYVFEVLIILIIIAAGFSVFSVGLSLFLSNRIAQPITLLNRRMKDISEGEGDLTAQLKINTKDELGELADNFNQFVGKIRDVISEVKNVISQLIASSTVMTKTSRGFSNNAQDQVAS